MKVAFISLGCAKNLVNTEQMMALCRDAGYTLLEAPAGADVVVINTCGFIDSAKEEAIDTILSVAALKAEGQVGKILVDGLPHPALPAGDTGRAAGGGRHHGHRQLR